MERDVRITLDAALYRTICVVLTVAIFFSNFANYSERWGFIPLYWVEVLVALTAPLLAGSVFGQRLPIRPLMVWCAGFLLISIAWYFPSTQDAVAYQQVQTRILSVIFVFLVLFLLSRPAEQHLARVVVAFTVLLGVALNVYEVFHPLTFSKIPGRSSGLFENSNQSGCALVLGLILSYGVVPSRLRIPFVALAGIGIVTTFTRSAILGWMVVVCYFAVRSKLRVRQLRGLLVFGLVVGGFVFSPYWGELQHNLEARGVLDLSNLQRLAFFSHGTATDQSADDRRTIAELGWRYFEEKPLTGHGTGAFRNVPGSEQGTHNIYIAMMVDHGIIGLFIVPTLILAVVWGVNRTTLDIAGPFALFLMMWGFFSHNVLEERYILLAATLVACQVTSARARRMATAPDRASVPAGAWARA
jgi:O-antigen ligase